MGDRGHNSHGPKRGELLCCFRGELELRLIQCGLGRGLLPYQVASSSIQPVGHNRHRPKIGWGGCAFFLGVAGSPSNTKSPGTRPTSIPSGILVHQAVWPQRTLAENWVLCPFRGGELGSHLTQCRVGRGYLRTKWHLDPCSCLAITDMGQKLGASCPFLGRGWVPI